MGTREKVRPSWVCVRGLSAHCLPSPEGEVGGAEEVGVEVEDDEWPCRASWPPDARTLLPRQLLLPNGTASEGNAEESRQAFPTPKTLRCLPAALRIFGVRYIYFCVPPDGRKKNLEILSQSFLPQ